MRQPEQHERDLYNHTDDSFTAVSHEPLRGWTRELVGIAIKHKPPSNRARALSY